MSLCPERETRDAMPDPEFWEHVLQRGPAPDPEDIDPDELTAQTDPCPECGERGACAYDAEGRALIHTTKEDDRG